MATNQENMYGFTGDDEVEVSGGSGGSVKFGLNQGKAKMTKFEYIPNGGKGGAEQDALDVEFTVEGREYPLRMRMFPVTRAFDKKNGNAEVTDPSHPEFRAAVKLFNNTVMNILTAYKDEDEVKAAFAKPITSFKDFAKTAESVLPANYRDQPLDIFMQYQNQIADGKDRTYLELPKNTKHGKFIAKATTNNWKEVKTSQGLKYVDQDDDKVVHPFQRGEWYVSDKSNFHKQQEEKATGSPFAGGTTSAGEWGS